MLVPFLPAIAIKSAEVKYLQELKAILPTEVASAVITSNGQLSPPHHYHRPTDETRRVQNQESARSRCWIRHCRTYQPIITEIKAKGGVLRSFRSICRGLPAPEFADNPFCYKFSWSARGVLEAGKNAAMYLKDGEMVNIPGGDLFLHAENVGLDLKHPKFLFYHKIGIEKGS